MSFSFMVKDVWGSDSVKVYHLVGTLREGKILSGDRAEVSGMPGVEIRIKSMVIAPRVSRDISEVTISIERPRVTLAALIGRELVSS
jgi:hypothetical protein